MIGECFECGAAALQHAPSHGGVLALVLGGLSYVWAYWLVASVVLGEAVVSFFMGYAVGSGWRGVAFYFCSALVVVAYGGAVVNWLLLHVPDALLRGASVVLVLALGGLVLWFQPGEVVGRTERPTTAPGSDRT